MSDQTVSKFDRVRGGLQGVALFTKPSTIQNVESVTGKSETFIVERCRFENGDYVFLQQVDDSGVVRVVLPPKVVNAISSHGDSLTTRNKSRVGKRLAQERKDRGEVPGF